MRRRDFLSLSAAPLQEGNLPVCVIIEITIRDHDLYSQYIERVRPIVERHGGRYLARGGSVTPIAGGWSPERVILIQFRSSQDVRRCFGSEEYRAIAPLRERSTIGKAIILEGCGGSPDA